MNNLEKLIRIGEELNNAIATLNNETNVVKNITEEKRQARVEEIKNTLQPFLNTIQRLNIISIDFRVGLCESYNGSTKSFGIRFSNNYITLVVYSNVSEGYYDTYILGSNHKAKSELLEIFLDNWGRISQNIESYFMEAVKAILEKRKNQAIADRENAIKTLTNMN